MLSRMSGSFSLTWSARASSAASGGVIVLHGARVRLRRRLGTFTRSRMSRSFGVCFCVCAGSAPGGGEEAGREGAIRFQDCIGLLFLRSDRVRALVRVFLSLRWKRAWRGEDAGRRAEDAREGSRGAMGARDEEQEASGCWRVLGRRSDVRVGRHFAA